MDPQQALRTLMESAGLKPRLFGPGSRYLGVNTATFTTPDGQSVMFLRRRFIPPLEEHSLLQTHTVVEGDRLDNLGAKYLGDPEQFWRICDANVVMRPNELTETPGVKIRISLPHGIQGAGDA
jgi:hypothetical protein